MKMLLLFSHPQVVQTCTNFFLLLNTKEDIIKSVIDFYSMEKITMEGQRLPASVWLNWTIP